MSTPRARATLATSCTIHCLHDGFSDLLYVLFPVWAREFSLSFAQVGLLKTGYSGALSLFQLPAGLLAERVGETRLLAAGTALTALGFLFLGTAGGFAGLLFILVAAGLGSGVQHPLSSSLVSLAYEGGPQRVALGTFNFSGDVGKTLFPACVALATGWIGWRWTTRGIGGLGMLAALAILVILSRLAPPPPPHAKKDPAAGATAGWGIRDRRGFELLSAIHGIDNGTRTAFLTYLPFLLLGKGAPFDIMGLALGLTFMGGAAGKFLCGALAERLGIIRTVILTEAATGLGILLLVLVTFHPALFVLPFLGVVLNGTSSVLYGTVAELVVPERRSRAYGLFYTVGIGSGALAPPIFGLLSDRAGVPTTLAAIALLVFVTLPLAHLLRPTLLVGTARAQRVHAAR